MTRQGDVFRLNPYKLDFLEIEQRLGDVQPRMASVAEARAAGEIKREETAEHWSQIREENTARRAFRAETRDADRDIRAAAATVQDAKQETIEVAEQAVDTGARASTRILGGVTKMFGRMFEALADMIAPAPPPTKEQAKQQARAEEEAAPVREAQRSAAEYEARLRELLQQDARSRALRRELGQEHDRDDDRGRERDR